MLDSFNRFLRKRRMRNLKTLMHAHRKIMADQLDLENVRLFGSIETMPLTLPQNALRSLVPEEFLDDARSVLRQTLLSQGRLYMLSQLSLVVAGSKQLPVIPLPSKWRKSVERELGITASPSSARRFWSLVVQAYLTGWRDLIALATRKRSGWTDHGFPNSPYQVFCDYSDLQLPDPEGQTERRNFTSWFGAQFSLPSDYAFVCANPKYEETRPWGARGLASRFPFPPVSTNASRFAFALDGLRLAATAATGFLTGRWWLPVMLPEAIRLSYVRRLPAHALAERYAFHSGNRYVRPLWTYDAARRGAKSVLCLYSGNFETYTTAPTGEPPRMIGWRNLDWAEVVSPDAQSRAVLRPVMPEACRIETWGRFLNLSDSGEAAPQPSRNYIAAFDVSPYREAFRAITGLHIGYYTMPVVEKFLTDLVAEAERLGYDVLLKPKNVESRNIDARYRQLLGELDRHPHVSIANERIAASRLAEGASAIISLPFATTAQLGGYLGIPSCYYDPTGDLRRFRTLSHGMDMLFGSEELGQWMAQQLRSPMAAERAVEVVRR